MKEFDKPPDVTGWKRDNWNGVILYEKGDAIILCDLDGKWWKVK